MPSVKRPGRVLIVCQHFWPESFRINDIAYYMKEQGCEVEVLCGLPNYPKGKIYEDYSFFKNLRQNHQGLEIHRTWEVPRGGNSNLVIFINYISFPFFSLFHLPRLAFGKYDKIFIYQLSPVMMALTGILLGKLRRIETTMYVLDLWPENLFSVLDIKNKFLRRFITSVSHWHYRNVDKLVVLSQKMKQRIKEVTGKPEDRIIIIPQACEKLYEEDVYDKDLENRLMGKFNIVFTGNISPAQSFETVLSAAEILRDEGIAEIRWVIVGDGMSRDWLEQEVKNRDLEGLFLFEGQKPVEDIPKYTSLADVLIGCLKKSELLEATIPLKVMSYLAAGRPIVLAMDGEASELINNEVRCGYVGPTENYKVFASNIKKLYLLSKKEREAMGARARDYHFAHFERNKLLARLYNFMLNP